MFVAASAAAFTFVATYLAAIYGAAAGSVYGLVKLAESSQRQQRLQQGQQRQRLHYE
jgi:hypothetical protein